QITPWSLRRNRCRPGAIRNEVTPDREHLVPSWWGLALAGRFSRLLQPISGLRRPLSLELSLWQLNDDGWNRRRRHLVTLSRRWPKRSVRIQTGQSLLYT